MCCRVRGIVVLSPNWERRDAKIIITIFTIIILLLFLTLLLLWKVLSWYGVTWSSVVETTIIHPEQERQQHVSRRRGVTRINTHTHAHFHAYVSMYMYFMYDVMCIKCIICDKCKLWRQHN